MRSIENNATLVKDVNMREGWHGKEVNRFSASKVQKAYRRVFGGARRKHGE